MSATDPNDSEEAEVYVEGDSINSVRIRRAGNTEVAFTGATILPVGRHGRGPSIASGEDLIEACERSIGDIITIRDLTDDGVTSERQFDIAQIPDSWKLTPDPTTQDYQSYRLDYYRGVEGSPSASIFIHTPLTKRGVEGKFTIEVQDKNADGATLGLENPQTVFESFDQYEDALERVYELTDQYPMEETEYTEK